MKNPLISVIVPVYKVERYLSNCLDSIINQSYKKLEIILIDDGSPDNCPQICDEYAQKDSRIVVIHQKNAGVSHARNVGIDIAKGDYIGFVDSDDYIEPDFYETLIKNAIEHDADISYCGIKLMQPNGSVEERFNSGKCELKNPEDIIKGFFFNEEIKEHFYAIWNKIFKKEILTELRYNENYALGEDILFMFEAIGRCQRIYLEDRTLYHYLRRENSAMTSSFSDKRMDYVTAAENLIEICRRNYPYVLVDALHWLYIHKLVLCRQLICNPQYKKKYASKFVSLKKELKQGKAEHYKRLNKNRKMDYKLVVHFPIGYKILKKLGKIK